MSEQRDARVPLSVLVPVKNEAANLRECLASLSFAQEMVVVDSGEYRRHRLHCRGSRIPGRAVRMER